MLCSVRLSRHELHASPRGPAYRECRLSTWTRSGSPTRGYGYDANGNIASLFGKTHTYDSIWPSGRLGVRSGARFGASNGSHGRQERRSSLALQSAQEYPELLLDLLVPSFARDA